MLTDTQHVALWRAWDAHPGRVAETYALVDACNDAADTIGLGRSEYRDLLQSLRRAGFDYLACIRVVRDAALRYGVDAMHARMVTVVSDGSRS